MGRLTLSTRIARRMNARRKTKGAGTGRPRLQDAPRCPCAVMTLARANARGKSREHQPECSFYRERASISN
jgi:hypothetical protein